MHVMRAYFFQVELAVGHLKSGVYLPVDIAILTVFHKTLWFNVNWPMDTAAFILFIS
jgi:hypothetical protein